jgi:hypothetical protein
VKYIPGAVAKRKEKKVKCSQNERGIRKLRGDPPTEEEKKEIENVS